MLLSLESRQNEYRHWEDVLKSESMDFAVRPENERQVLAEARTRLDRLKETIDRAQSAGENWRSFDEEIQGQLSQVRQAFLWLDAEADRGGFTLG